MVIREGASSFCVKALLLARNRTNESLTQQSKGEGDYDYNFLHEKADIFYCVQE